MLDEKAFKDYLCILVVGDAADSKSMGKVSEYLDKINKNADKRAVKVLILTNVDAEGVDNDFLNRLIPTFDAVSAPSLGESDMINFFQTSWVKKMYE